MLLSLVTGTIQTEAGFWTTLYMPKLPSGNRISSWRILYQGHDQAMRLVSVVKGEESGCFGLSNEFMQQLVILFAGIGFYTAGGINGIGLYLTHSGGDVGWS